jgi:hypothetical protein
VIGRDGLTADVQADGGGAVLSFATRKAARERGWLSAEDGGLRCVLPVPAADAPLWEVVRLSRDQVELEWTTLECPRSAVHARQIITVDDWGLHVALAVENRSSVALQGRWGFALSLRLPEGAQLAVPPGTLGAAGLAQSSGSPFAWPRRTMLRLACGDALEIAGYPPLARTEARRESGTVNLTLLSPGAIACGETVRAECRLKIRPAASAAGA